jgi:hypothetical protein
LWDHNYLPIQSVVFRRELYAKYGGFDEELENLEDWNLWVRYSQVDDFQMVDRVTSLFTIAGEGQSAYKRLIALDSYRAKAVQKNALVRVSLSPADVLAYSREIARYNTVFAIRRSSLRSFALRLPFAPYLYHGLRRLGRAITRRPV